MKERAINAQICGVNNFKTGETGEIVGLVAVKPDDESAERICIKVKFKDGKIDYYPVDNMGINSIKLDCNTWNNR